MFTHSLMFETLHLKRAARVQMLLEQHPNHPVLWLHLKDFNNNGRLKTALGYITGIYC